MARKSMLFSLAASVTLALALVFSAALPAYAQWVPDGQGGGYVSLAAEEDALNAVIAKRLLMPSGTNIPAAAFTFAFTAVSTDSALPDGEQMPTLADVIVVFEGDEALEDHAALAGTKAVVKESASFIPGDTVWPADGIYHYTVTETQGGVTPVANQVWVTDSNAVYDVEIWVEGGKASFVIVMTGTAAAHLDEYYDEGDTNMKVDPTAGAENAVANYSQLVFTSRYWKTTSDAEDPAKSALKIESKVAGNGADHLRFFSFAVTVTTPALAADGEGEPKVYKAYIVNESGLVNPFGDEADERDAGMDGDDADPYYLFTSGMERAGITLRHGESLSFVDLEVGAVVAVTQAPDSQYKPSYQRTFAGTGRFTAVGIGSYFGFPRADLDDGPHYTEEGSGANFNIATFTSLATGITPTGIAIDDLPYFVLLGAAVLALVVFVVVRLRKRAKYYDI